MSTPCFKAHRNPSIERKLDAMVSALKCYCTHHWPLPGRYLGVFARKIFGPSNRNNSAIILPIIFFISHLLWQLHSLTSTSFIATPSIFSGNFLDKTNKPGQLFHLTFLDNFSTLLFHITFLHNFSTQLCSTNFLRNFSEQLFCTAFRNFSGKFVLYNFIAQLFRTTFLHNFSAQLFRTTFCTNFLHNFFEQLFCTTFSNNF